MTPPVAAIQWEEWPSDSLPLGDTRNQADARHLGRESVAAGTLLAVFLLFGLAGALTYSASVNGLSSSVDGLSASLGRVSAKAQHVLARVTSQAPIAPVQRPRVAAARVPLRPAADPALSAASAEPASAEPSPSGPSAEPAPYGPTETAVPRRASILIFTARPGSIATTRLPTELCYAVSGASEARIEPGVGVVNPADTLTCRRVAPARTTTYELTAAGRDGIPVSEQVVIVVR